MVEGLTLLQLDPTSAIAPSADLVAWSRLGASYRPGDLTQALEQDRTLFEFNAVIRPMRDLGLYLVGKVDAVADRKASVLWVNAVHEDVPFSRTMRTAVRVELGDLASWLGLAAVKTS